MNAQKEKQPRDSSHFGNANIPSPKGILETVVYCENLTSAREFYEQVVGLPVVSVEPERHVFFRVGQGMLLVFNSRETVSGTGKDWESDDSLPW